MWFPNGDGKESRLGKRQAAGVAFQYPFRTQGAGIGVQPLKY